MPSSEAGKSSPAHSSTDLRRDVTIWGSFMWGYADVGADIYAALGLVIAATQGGAPLAFCLAGFVYIIIGLAYTELAAAYPVAGGGQYYAMRGLGDFWGFVAGVGLIMDYTIDVALFAVASAGYLNFLLRILHFNVLHYTAPILINSIIHIFGFPIHILYHNNLQWLFLVETLCLILFLVAINIRGMKQSSLLNEFLGAIDIFMECLIIIFGFMFAWKPEFLAYQWTHFFPSFHQFAKGASLAIISFVGLESISQAAQETRRPATIVPRTSITLIFTVFLFAVSFSTMSLGVLPWQEFAGHVEDPVAILAHALPYIGMIAGPLSATLGFTILLISANSGIMSVSRLTYSMSRMNLLTHWFDRIHPKFVTPVRTILVFTGISILQTILSFFTKNAMETLGDMYAFGATLAYIIVLIGMVRLRFTDPYSPRPYRMPFSVKLNRNGHEIHVPILAFVGILGVSTILYYVIWTHPIGRIAGPSWVLIWTLWYIWFRKKRKLPVFKSAPQDWEAQQKAVLASAEEFMMLEEYQLALKERDKRQRQA